jgi:penicillin-binding protein 1A
VVEGVSVFACLVFRWPYLFFANTFLLFDILGLRERLRCCLSSVPADLDHIPEIFVDVLILAEDHRSRFHFGVDPAAIIRSAVFSFIGVRQGGSTIEQQFVRVAVGEYDLTFVRKFREQILATLLSRRSDRLAVAKAYLAKAYYGTEFVGIHSFERFYGKNLRDMCLRESIEITARLKYPQPRFCSAHWFVKFKRRCDWIEARWWACKKLAVVV